MLQVTITKLLPDFTLDISFLADNNITVLFGPSGCGKTTTLRSIAGLTKPDKGSIILGNRTFFCASENLFIPPKDRQVGYMFQDYALFPHMTVQKNILYGTTKNKRSDTLLTDLLTLLKIGHLTKRYPLQLSGGEKQRVALARALMAEPKVLLLDEPLSSLDSTTRYEVQNELKNIHALWKIPMILVTHDPQEAQFMGDQIIFMDKGRQIAAPAGWPNASQNDE